MKIAIRYYSKTGNTEKLAEAIGEAIGVAPKTIDEPLNEDVDILFLGNIMLEQIQKSRNSSKILM